MPPEEGRAASSGIGTRAASANETGVRDTHWPGDEVTQATKTAIGATVNAVSAQAAELAGNVVNELTSTAEEQKVRGADTMTSVARAMETAARELEEQSPGVARQIRSAAESVLSLSDSVRDRSVGELATSVTELARRQPMAFFAGSVAAGFLLARFIKSSASAGNGADAGSAAHHDAVGDGHGA